MDSGYTQCDTATASLPDSGTVLRAFRIGSLTVLPNREPIDIQQCVGQESPNQTLVYLPLSCLCDLDQTTQL